LKSQALTLDFLIFFTLFLHHNFFEMNAQQEYQQELEKIQQSDFKHNWVSSSGFLFYLQVGCLIAFMFGACSMLYTKRYEKIDVPVQESTLYTPKYK